MGWSVFMAFHDREDLYYLIEGKPFVIMKCLLKSMPGSHIRFRGLIFPAFRASSELIGLSWAVIPGIAWVKAHDNRGR